MKFTPRPFSWLCRPEAKPQSAAIGCGFRIGRHVRGYMTVILGQNSLSEWALAGFPIRKMKELCPLLQIQHDCGCIAFWSIEAVSGVDIGCVTVNCMVNCLLKLNVKEQLMETYRMFTQQKNNSVKAAGCKTKTRSWKMLKKSFCC